MTTTTQITTPCYLAYLAAQDAADRDDCRCVCTCACADVDPASPERAAMRCTCTCEHDAARVHAEEAKAAYLASDEPRLWYLHEAGEGYGEYVGTLDEALKEAESNVDRANYADADGTLYIDVRIHCPLTGEEASSTVMLEPEEPECLDDGGHDWQSPFALVGGIKENPGVWGHGGGVIIHEACVRCGCRRTTDTWAQRRDTGEQGLTEVSYEPGYYDLSETRED